MPLKLSHWSLEQAPAVLKNLDWEHSTKSLLVYATFFFFCCKVKQNQQFIYEKSISCLFKDTSYIREQKANIRLPFELDLILD